MLKGIKLFQKFHARRLQRATARHLEELEETILQTQETIPEQLAKLRLAQAPHYCFGTTSEGLSVEVARTKALAHCAIEGASGAGKSFFAVHLAQQILAESAAQPAASLGVLDPKPELVGLLTQYLHAQLYQLAPAAREMLRQRIFLLDFSQEDAVCPYNLLARQGGVPDEILVASRLEMLSEQFSGLSPLTVRMKQVLKPFLLLMVEFGLPLPLFAKLSSRPLWRNGIKRTLDRM